MKILIVLLDGLGDRSYRELGGRTPLQAAETPNLDLLASLGSNGMYHASLSGQCLPSEKAHYLIFGYGPESFPGRGLLEAVGYGLQFHDEDVLCLAHLSVINWRNGLPVLENAVSYLRCKVTDQKELSTHTAFFCEVTDAWLGEGEPLIYGNYQKDMKTKTMEAFKAFRESGAAPAK